MKKFLYTLIIFLTVNSFACAMEIQGGVTYTVDSARDYVQQGLPNNNVNLSGPNYFEGEGKNTDRVIYSRNNSGDIIGITVLYINEPTKTYVYNKNRQLIYIDKYDKPVNVYPHRGYRYDMQGNLILTSLTVSKNELFRFYPDGSLMVHSVYGIIYDENGNVIGNGK